MVELVERDHTDSHRNSNSITDDTNATCRRTKLSGAVILASRLSVALGSPKSKSLGIIVDSLDSLNSQPEERDHAMSSTSLIVIK